ncbi:MAG: SgcJ/EcaC family oxidoreductase [Gemmatimonadota bacterium]
MRHLTLASLGLALIAGCAPAAPAAGSVADEEAMKAVVTAYATAWNAGDAKALAATVTEDYHSVDMMGAHVEGRAGMEKAAEAQFAMRPAGQTIAINTVYTKWFNGTTAASGGTWTVTGPAGPLPNSGSWAATWTKTGDTWLVATNLAAFAVAMPAGPMAADTAMAVKK